MAVLLKVDLTNWLYRMTCWLIALKVRRFGECHRTQMKSQYWFGWWLCVTRQQAIIWDHVLQDLCHHFGSLGHNEFHTVTRRHWLLRPGYFVNCGLKIRHNRWNLRFPYFEMHHHLLVILLWSAGWHSLSPMTGLAGFITFYLHSPFMGVLSFSNSIQLHLHSLSS